MTKLFRKDALVVFALLFLAVGYLPFYGLSGVAHGITLPATSASNGVKPTDPVASNATASNMSKEYIQGNHTTQLKALPQFAISPRWYVTNLKVDTFGGWFVYTVWQQNATNTNSAIFFSRSVDGGTTWTPAGVLSKPTAQASNPQVGAFGNEVYVIWEQKNPKNNDIYLDKSTDGGATFGGPINLSHTASVANATDSSLTIDKSTGKVIIAWAAGNYGYAHCSRC